MYDIFFISYKEPHAEANYQRLKERFIFTKRIENVKGIHQAHKAAAELSMTKMFYVVDADAEIVDDFNFDYKVPDWDLETTHVWFSLNPINNLKYGYGAVKLLPTKLVRKIKTNTLDMTMSISDSFKVINEVSNITNFNVDEFSTWRSAFREAAKLTISLRSMDNVQVKNNKVTQDRLVAWCTKGKSKPFGQYCIAGAQSGKQYAEDNISNLAALRKINNFAWLRKQFDDRFYSV